MTKRAPHQEHSPFRLSPVAVGAAALLVSLGAGAQTSGPSTQAGSEAPQTITVTGIRASLETATATKKNASTIVESINAEDIGKMPDVTIAESMARLPGVATQRDALGRARGISIRGLSNDFNGTTLNGREMASTGDSRGVEFDQFPAELLSSVLIHKTPHAGLVGQGIAATVDLRTVRPLDFRKLTFAVNARETRTGIGSGGVEGDGDRQAFSFINQFADRTIGVAFGFAKSNDKGPAISNGGGNAWGRWDCCTLPTPAGSAIAPAGFGEDVEQRSFKREGMMAAFQFRPNKNFETSLDLFRSKGTFGTKKTGIEGAIGCQPSAGQCNNFPYDPQTSLVASQPFTRTVVGTQAWLEAATVDGVKGVIRNHLEGGDDSLTAWGWNARLSAGGFDFNGDVSRSKVKRESDRFETTAGVPGRSTVGQVGTATWTGFVPGSASFENNLTLGGIDYTNRSVVRLTDVNGWSGGETFPQAGYNAHPTVTDEIQAGRLSARKDMSLGPIEAIEFGVNHTNREKIRIAPEGVLRILPGTDPYGSAAIPGSDTTFLPTLGISVASFDPRGSVGTIFQRVDKIDRDILAKDWVVEEKVTTAYVKGDLDSKLFGMPMTGNVGLQFVNTKQSTKGFNVNGNACSDAATCTSGVYTLASANHSYTDINPSLNLTLELGGDQFLRLGAARQMSRPNMSDMRASFTYSVNSGIVSGDAGNPSLEPFRANAIDLSWEKYFGNKGYISAAAFYKDLRTYIVRDVVPADFSAFLTNQPTVNPIGLLTVPLNGSGGKLSGVELSANLPLNMLSPMLLGFGIVASASFTDSNVKLPSSAFRNDGAAATIPLPGLSKNVSNLRVYYENFGLQVSVGARQRSDFLGEVSNFQDDRSLTFVKGDTVVDFQLAYELQSGPAKGLSAMFQINNLTNETFKRYRDDAAKSVIEDKKYGKTYLLGLNYKY